MLGCAFLTISIALSIWQHYSITTPVAFVTQNGVTVLQQPDLGAKEVTTLSIGTEVKPLSEFSRWQEVQLPDGRKGWVQGATLLHVVL
ncbi:MAG: SH3 domain-containing protein [bacterium]|nr:SH3 domain-containing protein [bacterium]